MTTRKRQGEESLQDAEVELGEGLSYEESTLTPKEQLAKLLEAEKSLQSAKRLRAPGHLST